MTETEGLGPPWSIVDHTADWSLLIRGVDWAALLRHAAQGLASLLAGDRAEPPSRSDRRRFDIRLEAPDRETLLVDWLSELAFLAETEGYVFWEIDIRDAEDTRLAAIVTGARVPLQKHVKAVTYHNLEVRSTAAGLEVTVVFDV